MICDVLSPMTIPLAVIRINPCIASNCWFMSPGEVGYLRGGLVEVHLDRSRHYRERGHNSALKLLEIGSGNIVLQRRHDDLLCRLEDACIVGDLLLDYLYSTAVGDVV